MRSMGTESGINLGPEVVGVIEMEVVVTVVDGVLVVVFGVCLLALVLLLGAFKVSIPSGNCSGRFFLILLATVPGVTFPI